MLLSEANFGVNLLPKKGRSLEKIGNSKENYQEQLVLNINELIQLGLDLYNSYGEVSILCIGGNNSTAIKDLKNILEKNGIPKNKIKLSKVDLERLNEVGVNYICGDLDYDGFLVEMVEKLGLQSQGIIFCNQVSQYLTDRLKVIKFVCDFLLKKGGKFYFNMILTSFFRGSGIPIQILEENLNKIMKEESSGIDVKIKLNQDLPGFRMYEITKLEENGELEVPRYSRIYSYRNVDGFKVVAYDFRYRTDLEKIREILKNKGLIRKIINPED